MNGDMSQAAKLAIEIHAVSDNEKILNLKTPIINRNIKLPATHLVEQDTRPYRGRSLHLQYCKDRLQRCSCIDDSVNDQDLLLGYVDTEWMGKLNLARGL